MARTPEHCAFVHERLILATASISSGSTFRLFFTTAFAATQWGWSTKYRMRTCTLPSRTLTSLMPSLNGLEAPSRVPPSITLFIPRRAFATARGFERWIRSRSSLAAKPPAGVSNQHQCGSGTKAKFAPTFTPVSRAYVLTKLSAGILNSWATSGAAVAPFAQLVRRT